MSRTAFTGNVLAIRRQLRGLSCLGLKTSHKSTQNTTQMRNISTTNVNRREHISQCHLTVGCNLEVELHLTVECHLIMECHLIVECFISMECHDTMECHLIVKCHLIVEYHLILECHLEWSVT